jgi:hypothetical protein
VTDAAQAQLRAAGAIVEEALDDDVGAASSDGEELILDKKAVLWSTVPIPAAVDLILLLQEAKLNVWSRLVVL